MFEDEEEFSTFEDVDRWLTPDEILEEYGELLDEWTKDRIYEMVGHIVEISGDVIKIVSDGNTSEDFEEGFV